MLTYLFVIFFRYLLAGIISWGVSCGEKDVPGVYASVDYALPFIAWDNFCHYGNAYSKYVNFPQHNNWIDQEIDELRSITGAGVYIRRANGIKNTCISTGGRS